jgi:hypothetical protein
MNLVRRFPSLVLLSALLTGAVAGTPASALSVAVGDTFPDFFGGDHNDPPRTFSLAAELGKVLLLHYCTLECGACQMSADAEADLAAAIDEQIGAENWALVDVLFQGPGGAPSAQPHAEFWRDHFGTPARTLHASGSTASTLYQSVLALGIESVPTYFVLAPDGTLAAIHVGYAPPFDDEVLVELVVAASPIDHDPPVIAAKKDVAVQTRAAPVLVRYTRPAATDAVDGPVTVSCQPASGSLFFFGRRRVDCHASDQAGNEAESSFEVVVTTPTTPGAMTNPGNLSKPLISVTPNQAVRATAGGFAPGSTVELFFVTSGLVSIELGTTPAGDDGRIDARVKVPQSAPRGASQFGAVGLSADGAELVRAWVVTVRGGPAS